MAARKPKDNTIRFLVNGEQLEIDPDDLSLGEVEDIEIRYDCDYESLEGTRNLTALVYTALKRVKPETTWEDVRQIKFSALDFTKSKRPTSAAPAAAGTPAS